ncbi:damage-inducible protein DinB [Deinococcus piscis]|uniref:Damage-inducible protein DinB n=1 Tax=Deinococcus piscis TaxID=394230 RepID=A0ABQ3K8V5_9DEIO|nr:DinB family protein [Deinococcus piscis]GHG07269.1 damage-inducible protein DinB [Deinococcus piscis]
MNIPDLYVYLTETRRDLWATLEAAPDDALSNNLLDGERFRCIKDLVFHIAEVEDGWIHGDLLRVPPVQDGSTDLRGRDFYADVPLAKLLAYWQAVEGDTLRHLPALAADPERVVTVEDWPPGHQHFRQGGLLWHVLLLEVRHTAQIAALLRVQGIRPPQLDLLFYLNAVDSGRSSAAFVNGRQEKP